MEENKVEEIKVEENKTEENGGQIVEIQQPGVVKKVLKGIGIGLGVVAAFVGGLLLGGRTKDDSDNGSSDAEEGPKDE
jgi:hypothetical protein